MARQWVFCSDLLSVHELVDWMVGWMVNGWGQSMDFDYFSRLELHLDWQSVHSSAMLTWWDQRKPEAWVPSLARKMDSE